MNYKKLLHLFLFLLIIAGCSKDESPEKGINKSANLKALGTSANDLLSDEKFTSLRIEVVYVNGYEPDQGAINNLKDFLAARIYKPFGITVTSRAVASSNKAPFNINEIVEIESQERSAFNTGDELAVFIYFADGSNEADSNSQVTLGSAYRNTSIVIYGETIRTIVNRPNSPPKSTIESTVIHHEFGHLFGLVDLGSPLQTSHKDTESAGHCNVEGCLMNANLQFGGQLLDLVDSNGIPDMDELCILDLQANGGQ